VDRRSRCIPTLLLVADVWNIWAARLPTLKKQTSYRSASGVPTRIKSPEKSIPHYADLFAAIFAECVRVLDCSDEIKRETPLGHGSPFGVFDVRSLDRQPEFFSIRISRKINADPLIWYFNSLNYQRWANRPNVYCPSTFLGKDDLINRTDIKRKVVGTFASPVVEPEKAMSVALLELSSGDIVS